MNLEDVSRARARGITFAAKDIATAIEEIRGKLGPDAVILDIRRRSSRGLARLWQPPGVEIVACLGQETMAGDTRLSRGAAEPPQDPEPRQPDVRPTPEGSVAAPAAPTVPGRSALERYSRSHGLGGQAPDFGAPAVPGRPGAPDVAEFSTGAAGTGFVPEEPPAAGGGWRCGPILERLGLLPLYLERLLESMSALHGPGRLPPPTLARELVLARQALRKAWRHRPTLRGGPAPLHVFIGPPGSGKTTALCKMLAQSVLVDSKEARIWRLDGRTANASEKVSIYADILAVPLSRSWTGERDPSLLGYVDLPGTEFQDPGAVEELAATLVGMPGARVHLVLNAAYSTPLLLAQARAFEGVPVSDLILTHLDEETAWSKLWNLVLGTDYPLSYLSAGQNIPGRFHPARPELLGASLFGAENG